MLVGAIVLLAVGYTVAVALLARLRPVLAERRVWAFVALEAAMAGIVVGWMLRGRPAAAGFNAAALAGLFAAWVVSGRRGRSRLGSPST